MFTCACLVGSGVLEVGFPCFYRCAWGDNSRGAPYPSDQPWAGPRKGLRHFPSLSLKTANVTGPRVPLGRLPPFPAASTGSLALRSSHCHRETQIKPFGEGGRGAKAFMPPSAPFCHPSCFTQQRLHSAPAAPGHGLPHLTLGGSTPWFSRRLEAGRLWCRGMLMLQGWRDAGGGVLFAVSTRSPVSRSVTLPAAAVCWNQQRGGRWIGRTEGEADK